MQGRKGFIFSHFQLLDSAHKSHDKYPKIHIELQWEFLLSQWYVDLVPTGAKKDYLNWFVSVNKLQAHHENYKKYSSFFFVYL